MRVYVMDDHGEFVGLVKGVCLTIGAYYIFKALKKKKAELKEHKEECDTKSEG